MIRKILLGSDIALPRYGDILVTLARVFAGLSMALAHGLGKVFPSERFIASVGNMGFPVPILFAYAAMASEFLGGLLLAAGLFTRPSAFFILLTMLTAGFIRHSDDPFSSMEKALLFAALALVFIVLGGGRYSADAWLRKRLKK